MAYQGHLDWPRGRELGGWVYDPEQPGHRARVDIHLDGAVLRTRTASNFRPDLKQAGIGDGCHAFSVELPENIFDGHPHRIEACINGVVFQSFVYQSKYGGVIEAVSPESIRYQLRDESLPGASLVAEIYADGRYVASGFHATAAFPRGFDVSKVKRLELRARGCDQTVAEWTPAPVVFHPVNPPDGPVDVIVGASETITALLRTLESIASSSNESVSAVFVDTDGRHHDALLETQQRLAFQIGAPPAGSGHDTVHLAAGSLVSGSWLDRLRTAAYADAAIATASPLTGGPVDGHSARELDAVARRTQPGSYALIECGSSICQYRKAASGGTLHVLAGDVRVEALHPMAPVCYANMAAARLQRAVDELAISRTPPVSVLPGGILLVDGVHYELPEDLEALHRVVPLPLGIAVDSALATVELAGSGIPYQIELKDYGWICPRGDLIDETGRYCGEPSIEACERCLRKLGPGDGLGGLLHRMSSVAELREQSRRILDGAEFVKFPSKDAAQRMARYCSPKAAGVAALSRQQPIWRKPVSRPLRLRRIGEDTTIWQACLWDARKRELPLEFVIYGEAHAEWLASEAPPLSVPEFTLYPIQFDIGAVAEGALRIPCGLPASRINDLLVRGLTS